MTDTELLSIVPMLKKLKAVDDVRISLGDATSRFLVKTKLIGPPKSEDEVPLDTDGVQIDSCSGLSNMQ